MKNIKIDLSLAKSITFCFCVFALIMIIFPEIVYADSDDMIAKTLCKVTDELNGPIGKAVATIGVVVLGIGLFLGKLSWPIAVATALGIGLIFGASQLVDMFGNTGAGASGDVCATFRKST